jgi:hypothetical protein
VPTPTAPSSWTTRTASRSSSTSGFFPAPFVSQLPISSLTAIGEIKLLLREGKSIKETVDKLAKAAALRSRVHPVPFFVVAGQSARSTDWAVKLVASLARSSPGVWPAVFSFDRDEAVSVLRTSAGSALRATTGDGDFLDGVITIISDQLSPSAVLYLWIWAAIHADSSPQGMDFRFMRQSVSDLSKEGSGLTVEYRSDTGGKERTVEGVLLVLPDERPGYTGIASSIRRPSTHGDLPVAPEYDPIAVAPGPRRVMLITLGGWVDEPDTWDESAWGGSAQATRDGYGYRPGMSDTELLDAARLFWKWRPDSPTWDGIEYAVVAHAGLTRAVLRIDQPIGPFWGRWGFQGRVVKAPALVGALVNREVPQRQNPITSITL